MKNKNYQSGNIAYIVIALVVIAIGFYFITSDGDDRNNTTDKTENESLVMEEKAESRGAMMEDGTIDSSQEIAMAKKGTYEAYSADKLALADTGSVVLFFHASWCPFCRSAEADINKNISSIPEGVHILKTDYDKETSLKQKYGVTTQHTFVQVDKEGNLIKKWSGSETLAAIVGNIQ